jgi:hypothetical protein
MQNRSMARGIFALLLGLLLHPVSVAQAYDIEWFKIAGGGGTSTDGFYTLSGTLGQSEAGVTMSGGIYSVTGGAQFESEGSDLPPAPLRIVAIQLLNPGGTPELHIAMVGTPGRAFQLQFTPSLALAITWSNLGALAISPSEGRLEFVDPNPPGARFYRITESPEP